MCVINKGHFIGREKDLKEIHLTIEFDAEYVIHSLSYTDRSGRNHLYIEFDTIGKANMETFRCWQQVEMTIDWAHVGCEEWSTWEPAIQHARRRWNL
jgi:hypothetical protein